MLSCLCQIELLSVNEFRVNLSCNLNSEFVYIPEHLDPHSVFIVTPHSGRS